MVRDRLDRLIADLALRFGQSLPVEADRLGAEAAALGLKEHQFRGLMEGHLQALQRACAERS